MVQFHVDSERVLATASAVSALSTRLSADTAAMLSQLESVDGAWSGAAARAFSDTVAQWRSTQQMLEQSLTSIHQALAAAGQQYADVEAANLRMFSAGR